MDFALCLIILLTFSQVWVFPMLGEKGDQASSGFVRALFFPAYGMGLVLFALSISNSVLAVLRQPFLLLLLAIAMASVLWSVAPDQSLRRGVALYATTLCGVVLVARRTWVELFELFATAYALLVGMSFAFAVLFPSIGIMHELFPGAWRGGWAEKNQLGGMMSLGICVFAAAAVLSPVRRRLWIVFACLAFLLILLSASKTSLVASMLAMSALVFALLLRRGPVVAAVMTWMAVVVVGLLVAFVMLYPDLFFALLGKDATFTGRTEVWQPVLRQIAKRPWTGFGYGAVWTEEGRWGPLAWITKQAGFRATHAHNSWLEQWLGVGIPGLAAFVLMQVQFLMAAVMAAYRGRDGVFALPIFICYTLMCFTESVAVIYNDFHWLLFTAIAVKLAWPDWRATADRKLAS